MRSDLHAKIVDWLLIGLAGFLLIIVFLSNISAEISDPLRRDEQLKWYFGEELSVGDLFEYKICDSILKIPQSPDQCYVVTLEFLRLLPSPEGKLWIVAVHVDHKVRQVDMIFQISADSFKIKTDGTTIPYAQSVERTLWWINQHASKFETQTLAVGKSWGVIASDTEPATDLLLNQVDSVQVGDETYETYKIGYFLVKESFIQIKDGFPFPVKAVIYKPVSSYQHIPLAFTIDLLSYSRSSLCYPSVFESQTFKINDEISAQTYGETLNDTAQYDELLDDDSDDEFDTVSTDAEIAEIENYANYENQSEFDQYYGNVTIEDLRRIPNEEYSKIEQAFGNFTRILQFLTDAANRIIVNQTENK